MHKTKGSYVLKALVAVMFLGVGTAAHAKKPKISILHCGVDEVTETMVYNTISVSKASKGHANHVVGSIDSEGTGEWGDTGDGMVEEIFVDYVRTGADCCSSTASCSEWPQESHFSSCWGAIASRSYLASCCSGPPDCTSSGAE